MPDQEQESALVRLVKDLLAPGVSNKLILFLNISLLALIFILFSLVILGYGNVHVFITLFLSCGLLVSANYTVKLLNDAMKENQQQSESVSEKTNKDKTE